MFEDVWFALDDDDSVARLVGKANDEPDHNIKWLIENTDNKITDETCIIHADNCSLETYDSADRTMVVPLKPCWPRNCQAQLVLARR